MSFPPIAPDFFDYFLATRKLLDKDDTLYCVSAWNDNGKEDSIDPSAIDILYRSDFFPGLGWMLTRKIWNDIGSNWPKGFWEALAFTIIFGLISSTILVLISFPYYYLLTEWYRAKTQPIFMPIAKKLGFNPARFIAELIRTPFK